FTDTRNTYAEIQSLSTNLPRLSVNGKVVWEPASAGVEFQALPGAMKPGSTPAARLREMRALAAEFTVVADYGVDKEMQEDLRLMVTPIHRYQSEKQGAVDGGLFAYTKGIDPDAFLMIEVRKGKDGDEWQYAFARFNGSCALKAVRK